MSRRPSTLDKTEQPKYFYYPNIQSFTDQYWANKFEIYLILLSHIEY